MRSRDILVIFFFVCICICTFCINIIIVHGYNYTSTRTIENSEVIWVCSVCDESEMSDIFDPEDDFERDTPDWNDYGFWKNIEQGAKMRWYIKDLKEESEYLYRDSFKLKFKLWKWTMDAEWGKPDEEDAFTYVYSDPEYIGEDIELLMPYDYTTPSSTNDKHCTFFDEYIEVSDEIYYIDTDDLLGYKYLFHYYDFGIPLWLPTPTDDYLENMDFGGNQYVDDFTLKGRIKESHFKFGPYSLPNEYFRFEAEYNEQGFMLNFKGFNKDKELICEFSLQTINLPSNFGYIIGLSLLGILLIAISIVVYFLIKLYLNKDKAKLLKSKLDF
ncbi:MAG: hypothetical protein EU548_06095 [Promethearchaeota archaeon]|nr:MAG: hypothetical protein EU548_06095 [Candidatus Lokiarchaeota archaeon]